MLIFPGECTRSFLHPYLLTWISFYLIISVDIIVDIVLALLVGLLVIVVGDAHSHTANAVVCGSTAVLAEDAFSFCC